MICPIKNHAKLVRQIETRYAEDCIKQHCAWWDSFANFDPKTKQFEGQCCILTLSRLKISGSINTHPY